jgi:hypothetical protein
MAARMTIAMAQLIKRILKDKGGEFASMRNLEGYHKLVIKRHGGARVAYNRADKVLQKERNEQAFIEALRNIEYK